MLGLSKKYALSIIEVDKLTDFFNNKIKYYGHKETIAPKQIQKPSGYCIRTGAPIPFNTKHPMNNTAYESWKKFNNPDYPEKYCHFSGELSNGETTFSRPILRKNWNKAKEIHNL
jgi:hypothetical protein